MSGMRLGLRLLPAGTAAALVAFASGCIGQSTNTGNNSSNAGSSAPPASQSAGGAGAGRASDAPRTFDLDTLPTAIIQVNGKDVRVWLAVTSEQQQEGLMHVPASEIADDQGMLFVFPDEDLRFFWMKDTITALDIAYARMNGNVVRTVTMPPLTLQSFPSIEPAMFALEMKAGAFAALGLQRGGRIVIPEDVFKASR